MTANNGTFQGVLDSSEIYATKIVGLNKETYELLSEDDDSTAIQENENVFVEIGKRGIRLLKKEAEKSLQKFGLTVGGVLSPENVVLALGAGTREGDDPIINGVRQYSGCFVIDKGEGTTSMGIRGGRNFIYFHTDGSYDDDITIQGNIIHLIGQVNVGGDRVATYNNDILPVSKILNNINQNIANLERRITALENQ